MAQDQSKSSGRAAKKAEAAPASTPTPPGDADGTAKPAPHEAENPSNATEADGTAPQGEVEAQRETEQTEQMDAAVAAGVGGAATPAEKGVQTRAAKDVRDQAAADAEERARQAAEAEKAAAEAQAGVNTAETEDAVQQQRRTEAEKAAEVALAASGTAGLSEKDQRLLAAAPGGARTALTDGREGSTTVAHTAATSRPPTSGPLSPPITDVENLAATEHDPDNRVYADEAGPRDVFDEVTHEARFVDADGNPLDYSDMFDDEDPGKTFVTTRQRVYEVFTYPNATTTGRRMAYTEQQRVPRGEAEQVRGLISPHVRLA